MKTTTSTELEPRAQRGKYFADGPPVLTLRQAELYGLIPYNRTGDDDDEIFTLPNTIQSNMFGNTV